MALSPLKIFAVEDNVFHQERIKLTLERMDYKLLAVAETAEKAFPLIKKLLPDLVMLDIDLAGQETGIELGHKLNNELDTPIIYLTAYQDKEIFDAAKATHPAAYLTKPIQPDLLQRSIELAILRNHGRQQAPENLPEQDSSWPSDILHKDTVFVKIGTKLHKINLQDIYFIHNAGNHYCELITQGRKVHIRSSLSEISKKLINKPFTRVHRSYLINMDWLEAVHESEQMLRVGGQEVPLGKTYRQSFLKNLPRW